MASIAFPPLRKVSSPAWLASGCAEATAPFSPPTDGRVRLKVLMQSDLIKNANCGANGHAEQEAGSRRLVTGFHIT